MSTVVKDLGAVSAYAYAVEKGYTGTEAEFAELMADYAEVGQRAEDAATTATNKASEATTAAQTATTKAGEAQTSAQTASTKASEAVGCVETATQKATESAQSASQALGYKNDAESAKTASQTAQGLAEQAKADAITAKTDAESARDEAQEIVDGINAKAEQIATNAEDISQLKSEFADMKSDGAVPSAEQILSDKGVTDSVPYHYRKTGGDGADRLYDQIVGGSLVWNQLVPSNNKQYDYPIASQTWLTRTIGINSKANHVYAISAEFLYTGSISVVKPYFQYMLGNSFTRWPYYLDSGVASREVVIAKPAQDESSLVIGVSTAGQATFGSTDSVSYDKLNVFDLTAMFGSTIADYIYQLEQTTAGAGVAFFKSLFPNDYYSYNAGELMSVSGLSEHKTVGFNQWDEESEDGTWNNTTGAPVEAIASRRNKNPISVVPNTSYYTNKVLYRYFYDSDMTFLSYDSSGTNQFTTPANARYMNIKQSKADWDGTNTNISLSDPAKNGVYEPYKKNIYPLDSSLTLRGIPKLTDGKMYFDGDKYNADGTVQRRYGIVDLGTLNWTKQANDPVFMASGLIGQIAEPDTYTAIPSVVCAKYEPASYLTLYSDAKDKTVTVIWSASGSHGQVCVRDSAYTDAAAFKAAMSGVMLVYELAIPTTEEATPFRQLQICDPNGTEEYVSTGIVPVGHETRYPENLRAKIEGLPWNFASLIAPTESAFVATRNYTTGSLFIVNNVLYKATSNIANDGTITPNTNCTATTLAEIISALA